jgi:hypothetical protein
MNTCKNPFETASHRGHHLSHDSSYSLTGLDPSYKYSASKIPDNRILMINIQTTHSFHTLIDSGALAGLSLENLDIM